MRLVMEIKPAGQTLVEFSEDGFKLLNLILTQFSRCPIDRLDAKVHCEISRIFIKRLDGGFHQPLDLTGLIMLRGLYASAKKGLVPAQAFVNCDGQL